MKRPMPWSEQVDLISSDELSSSTSSSSSDTEMGDDNASGGKQSNDNVTTDKPIKEVKPADCDGLADADSCDALREQADLLLKRAEMYQDYMQQLPIPTKRGSVIPYTSWVGLGRSIKQLYDQPLHYLTNIHLKQWDQLRFGMVNDHRDLDTIMHPLKAEATIWLIEEIHRHTSSHHQIAKLWSSDPMHDAFIDSIVPQSPSQ